ncbi:MAG TPA: GNAT family protein [Acidimicrobiales bacterium]|nr:GNAT family protein [Acidimicrobiales bacterium]
MTHPYWPLFDLRLRTPRLELRVPTDDDFGPLLDAVDAGIHDPATMPFSFPWTDVEPVQRRRNAAQHWWRQRAEWSPEKWNVPFAVTFEGQVVGMQDVMASDFPSLRTVETGSWLTQRVHGRGIGREMRSAVLHFAFDVLGAEVAKSGAFRDNPASLAVSRALGYEDDGVDRAAPRGDVRELVRLRLTRDKWQCAYDVTVECAAECLPMFGLG